MIQNQLNQIHTAARLTQLDVQSPVLLQLPTGEKLRQCAGVRVGDALLSRMPISGERIPCTVVQTGPHWFRVRWNHSGVSECFSYHALLKGELRREKEKGRD